MQSGTVIVNQLATLYGKGKARAKLQKGGGTMIASSRVSVSPIRSRCQDVEALASTLIIQIGIERLLGHAEAAYIEALRLNRSFDERNVRTFHNMPDKGFDKISEFWNLLMLCVSPSFQRRGVGGRLLDWGFDNAIEEGVPVAVQSSPAGEGLYRGKGFRVIAWVKITEGIEDPVMIWEPAAGTEV